MSDGESITAGTPPENSQNEGENGSDDTNDTTEFKGWLTKRTKISHKWKKQWCLLRKTDLFYGDSEENCLSKKLSLDGAEITETDIDKKPYAFRLRPLNSKRIFYFHCSDEESQQQWMQAICFAKAASKHGDSSQACVVQ